MEQTKSRHGKSVWVQIQHVEVENLRRSPRDTELTAVPSHERLDLRISS